MTIKNKNSDFHYSQRLGMYILKNTNSGKSIKEYSKYNANFNSVNGLPDDTPIKVTPRMVVGYIDLLFSGKYNPVTQVAEMKKELKNLAITTDRFLHIRLNLEKLCKQFILTDYLIQKRNSYKLDKGRYGYV